MNYTISVIDFPTSNSTIATGSNTLGEVVGYYIFDNIGDHNGFLYYNGVYTTVADPLGNETYVWGINTEGQIVGSYSSPSASYTGFLYDNGSYTKIAVPLAFDTDAHSINDSGTIVGNYFGRDLLSHGFVYEAGAYTRIDDPLGVKGTALFGINDLGQMVGSYTDGAGQSHGFLYSNGTYTTIDYDQSDNYLLGITDGGTILGRNGANMPFLYNSGNFEIPSLGIGPSSIDNSGQITGYSFDSFDVTYRGVVATPIGPANRAPIIDIANSTLLGALNERDGVSRSPLVDYANLGGPTTPSGVIVFSDLDLSDRPTASILVDQEFVQYLDANANDITNQLSPDLILALEQGFSIKPEGGNTSIGAIDWTYAIPDNNLDFVGAGEQVQIIAPVKVDDGHGATVVKNLLVTVYGANDNPIASPDTATVQGGATITTAGPRGVLANDRDPDLNDLLHVTAIQTAGGTTGTIGEPISGLYGTLTINPDGGYTYAATSSQAGQDTFTYTIQDGHGATTSSSLAITVQSSGVRTIPEITTIPNTAKTGAIKDDPIARISEFGLVAQDKIDLPNLPFDRFGNVGLSPDYTLQITEGDQVYNIQLDGTVNLNKEQFVLSPDGHNGTLVSLAPIKDTIHFNIVYSTLDGGPLPKNFNANVVAAAEQLGLVLSDAININLNVGVDNLFYDPNAPTAVSAGGENEFDATIPLNYSYFMATLRGKEAFSIFLPPNDPTGSAGLSIGSAEAKALNMAPSVTNSAAYDGWMGLHYDNNLFQTTEHEITEVLGRRSGASLSSPSGNSAPGNSVLDLFRYGDDLTLELNPIDVQPLNGSPEYLSSDGTPTYFSIDGGATSLNTFSDGAFHFIHFLPVFMNDSGGDWYGATADPFNFAFDIPGIAASTQLSRADLLEMNALGYSVPSRLLDGYIANATVFEDTNGNGVLDPGETATTTDSNGRFSLPPGVGSLIAFGGTDITNGLDFQARLSAPTGAFVITPLTTLITTLQHEGIQEPDQQVLKAFGLNTNLDLTTFDPVAALSVGDTDGAEIYGAGAKVIDTAIGIGKAIADLGGNGALGQQQAFEALSARIAQIQDGVELDLSNPATIGALFNEVAYRQAIVIDQFSSAVADAIAAGNAAIDQAVITDATDGNLLNVVSGLQSISQTNLAPVAVDAVANATTGIGGTAAGNVLAGDFDPDGDQLSATGFSGGSHGKLTLDPDGAYSYSVRDLTGPTGSHLHDLFTYGISDGRGGIASANLDVTLNRAPIAMGTSANATTGVGGTASGNVLASASEPDGDPLTVTGFSGGTRGELALNPDGFYSYNVTDLTGPTGSHLHDVFTYGVSDGFGGSASANLDIALNRAPVAVNASANATTGVAGTASGNVLTAASDPDADPLTVTGFSGGSHGKLTLNSNGSYDYSVTDLTGPTGSHLHDLFTYSIADGFGGTATANLDITLNRAPVVVNTSAGLVKGGVSSGNVLANDSDPDGGTLKVTGITSRTLGQSISGKYGALTLNGDGTYSYVANKGGLPSNLVPQDTFGFTVADNDGDSSSAMLSLLILNPSESYSSGTNTTLIGGNGKDVLDGSLGHDILLGGNGPDILIGGAGDTLAGGNDPDTFLFRSGFGFNDMTDFDPSNDVIQFGAADFANYSAVMSSATQVGSSVLISHGSSNVLTLEHTTLSTLHQSDFQFG